MGNATFAEWCAPPVREKAYWSELSKKTNREIQEERGAVAPKLRDYSKVGPLGSLDKRHVVDIDELFILRTLCHILCVTWLRGLPPRALLWMFSIFLSLSGVFDWCTHETGRVSNLSALLNTHGSRIAEMWKTRNIYPRYTSEIV